MAALKNLLLAGLLLVLGACATAHKWDGQDPDLKLSGEPARQELDRYSFKRDGFFQQGDGFHVGTTHSFYTLDSLAPMMARTTPETHQDVARIQRGFALNRIVGWTSLALFSLGSLLDGTPHDALIGAGLLGGAWWAGRDCYLRWQLTKISDKYNDELADRFAPRFSWVMPF